jgi:hypothetical protein
VGNVYDDALESQLEVFQELSETYADGFVEEVSVFMFSFKVFILDFTLFTSGSLELDLFVLFL